MKGSEGQNGSGINEEQAVEGFIARWSGVSGTERANYQLFLTELCTALELPQPDPASDSTADNAYVFERCVQIDRPDGSHTHGFIDLYRRGCFVLEAKQSGKALDSSGWDKAMLAAQNQADQYVRALPADEGRPPFIVVVDVGRSLELYSEFTRSGGTYVPFPDPRHHRIRLEDLRNEGVRSRLRALWLSPEDLDPASHAARVTREVSRALADLAKSLEADGYAVDRVAHFLKRCLFTMFCEDVELLPRDGFTHLLEKLQDNPEHFPDALRSLWQTMNTGGYEGQLMAKLQRFNGGLFQDIDPIPLNAKQIGLLIRAGRADWRFVEPAIFGTLLERALDPRERHKLGAHYTPRAYVERLVMPTIIEPLREQWRTVQVAAAAWQQQDKPDKALAELKDFHHHLCELRILDPACGSGNFLYVALEHLKRLEGEVLNLIRDLSAGQTSLDTEGLTVGPKQFLGLELNPRAAAIAEVVLWIGYLQWHYRLHGVLKLPEPILRDFHNIECRDALIDFEAREQQTDDDGNPVTIWDGISYKPSPVTGELIPDETGRTSVYRYTNPRKAEWPKADYIVGNPPFVGEKRMRDLLGDGYVEAVRKTYSDLPACDLVMYWWHKAAELAADKRVRRFGFITTNSIVQSRNRKVTEPYLGQRVSLAFAVPDHPWVDAGAGAAVRIAMTVALAGAADGELWTVREETDSEEEARLVTFNKRHGRLFADLRIGAPLLDAGPLQANDRLVYQGVKLVGDGFLVSPEGRQQWVAENPAWQPFLPQLVAGSDLTKRRKPRYCIDFFGCAVDDAKARFAPGYQQILHNVKPFRESNKDRHFREKWWLFGRTRGEMRDALGRLTRYITTSEVSKHRYFVFLSTRDTIADGSLAVVALEDAEWLGILSSRLHCCWALVQGGALEDRPRWQNGPCFLNFPFPEPTPEQARKIRDPAEQLDAHRKQQQAAHPDLTLTGMYNVLEKLRAGEALTAKERSIHEQGLVSILAELHDKLDRAVFAAYGWDDLAETLVGLPGATTPLPDKPPEQAEAEEELLSRLVALNAQRAAEEAQGHIRWLRPGFQAPGAQQTTADLVSEEVAATGPALESQAKQPWPKTMPEQVQAVRAELAIGPQTVESLATRFKRRPLKSVAQVLAALEVLGQANHDGEKWVLQRA